jgi:hypothetical protein
MSRILSALGAVLLAGLLSSCGHPTSLQSISVTPTTVQVIGQSAPGTGSAIQFKAFGKFAHPSETREITNEVVWDSNIPDVVTVDSHGMARSGLCGVAQVTATATNAIGVPLSSLAVLTASADFTVADPSDMNCPQPTP